jgi:hypothetical protein
MMADQGSSSRRRFPIPVSLHDLEREPYNLLPYPADFPQDATNDEAARADAFDGLLRDVVTGNRRLVGATLSQLFVRHDDDDEEPWMEESRVQALYTLVR